MVTDLVIEAFLASLEAVMSLMPAWDWPVRTIVGTVGFVGQANRVVPVATIAAMFGLYIGLLLVIRVFDLAVWVYHQFWGAS